MINISLCFSFRTSSYFIIQAAQSAKWECLNISGVLGYMKEELLIRRNFVVPERDKYDGARPNFSGSK